MEKPRLFYIIKKYSLRLSRLQLCVLIRFEGNPSCYLQSGRQSSTIPIFLQTVTNYSTAASVRHVRADLARIQKSFRVEYSFDTPHQIHHVFTGIVFQATNGNGTDAVFTGD